jgi:hypothetical protein
VLYFTAGLSFVLRSVANVLYHWADFFSIQIFLGGEKTQINESYVGGPSTDPVLILYLDPRLNPDLSANLDPVANSDPVANPDLVEYRSGCRIRVRINSVTNPDQFSYSMAVINPDLVKNPVTNLDQVTTPDPVSKPDPVLYPITDSGLARILLQIRIRNKNRIGSRNRKGSRNRILCRIWIRNRIQIVSSVWIRSNPDSSP